MTLQRDLGANSVQDFINEMGQLQATQTNEFTIKMLNFININNKYKFKHGVDE
jgi:hypothetical protein